MLEKDPVMNQESVMSVLPHRSPMLMINEVLTLAPMESIEATLYIDPAWEIFQGHFPGNPVFPGVLSVECMAQAADIMLMTAERYKGKTPLLAGVDGARFYQKIVPGSHVTAKVNVARENAEKAVVSCNAELYLDEKLAAKCTVTLAMR
ncbi:beta-hydroxyacyl-ACP dehydratase [Caproiciproducens sp. NJN-50]|uniref:3-hydroxyacyl-ACP dehydratase FabZ n=2 Tax=Acutalibacteraceae TaxID=3082771 RepID=UPI000FFE1869|nr:3-hydroxyacyl-ACP dehydratase FabZ [Caproiciproducens sp. NJN-50]QAT50076.1 beta-hydroxyacyl-ACP dehydratase [Caproiciproducens sp. NJN-50]